MSKEQFDEVTKRVFGTVLLLAVAALIVMAVVALWSVVAG